MRFSTCSGAVVLTSLLIPSHVFGQAPDARVRKVQRSPGKPVSELVQPHEDTILLMDTTSRPLEVLSPANVSIIDWKSQGADAIMVAEVHSVDAKLSQSQDWITSTITGSIVEVLKKPRWWNALPGDQLSFNWDGGEILIGGTRVIAVVPWSKPFEQGKRYLMFFGADPSNKTVITGPTAAYEMTEVRGFRRLAQNLSGDEEIEKLSPEAVLIRIRAAGEKSP